VVTGATGRTGALTYNLLKKRGLPARALVRDADKARTTLGCDKCDETEGIFVGDITKPESMEAVMKGAGALVIITSAVPHCDPFPKCDFPKGGSPIDIDWIGAKNQIQTLAKVAGEKPVVLVSTMGTTEPSDGLGQISFYKLNFEAFLMASGFPFTIVKPCGLGEGNSSQQELEVGHDDAETNWDLSVVIQRADVARVLVEIAQNPAPSAGLRFDLCAKAAAKGSPTTDEAIPALLEAARYPWMKSIEV
jgi:uncharacterized protein YbjT (DUF2867 family)